MIRIYASDCVDFSTNGLGTLLPIDCEIEEYAGGLYELKLEHPIDELGRWSLIDLGRIIKAPAPKRESPFYETEAYSSEEETEVTVERWIYKINTASSKLNMRKGPGLNYAIIGAYPKGTEVVGLERSGDWLRVSILNGGATGWMSLDYLRFSRIITEVITSTQPVTREAVSILPSRDQLFRVYSVETDTESGTIIARAAHIFYDLSGNLLNGTFEPKGVQATVFVSQMMQHLLNPNEFDVYTPNLTGAITGDYSYKSPVEIMLDPDEGIVAQTGAALVRDNWDVFLLPDEARDMGVTVRRGKNLIGVTTTYDMSEVVTRIIPVGKDARTGHNNADIFLDGTIYVDSPHVADYSHIRAVRIDYDVKLVDSDADNETTFLTYLDLRAKLQELAEAEFSVNGIDLPTYGMEVDFVLLEDAEGFEDYASLQAVHIYDTVTIIDDLALINTKLRMIGYVWDALTLQYKTVTLGTLNDLRDTVNKLRPT